MIVANGAKVSIPDKQDTVSINSENVSKDFDSASFSVNGEEAPPAYRKPTRASVQVARLVAVTVVAVALILGTAIVLAAWIQTRSVSSSTQIVVEAPAVPENEALISSGLNLSSELEEKDLKGHRRLDEGNELESEEVDMTPQITVIKLPFDVNFGDVSDEMINFNNRGKKNCYVEKKKIEEVQDDQKRNLNVTSDPLQVKVVGEKVIMICDDTPRSPEFPGMLPPLLPPMFHRPEASLPFPRIAGRPMPFPFQGLPQSSPFSLNLNPLLARSQPQLPRNDVFLNPFNLPFPFNQRQENPQFLRMQKLPVPFGASISFQAFSDEEESEEDSDESEEEPLQRRPNLSRFPLRLNNLLLNKPNNSNQGRRFENSRRSFERSGLDRPVEDPEARRFTPPRPGNPFQALVRSFVEQARMKPPAPENRRQGNPPSFNQNRPPVNRPMPVNEPSSFGSAPSNKMVEEERIANLQLPLRIPATAIPQLPRQLAVPNAPNFNPANAHFLSTSILPPAPPRQQRFDQEQPVATRNARFLQQPLPLPQRQPNIPMPARSMDPNFIQPR